MIDEKSLIAINFDGLDIDNMTTKDLIKYQVSSLAQLTTQLQIANIILSKQEERLDEVEKNFEIRAADIEIKNKKEIEIVKRDFQEEIDRAKEIAIGSMRVNSPKSNYVKQGDFGRFFSVSIGSRTIGKLFKIVGLSQKKGRTIPYRQMIPKYAKCVAHKEYTEYVWHFENCMKLIDDWLRTHNLYDDFYIIETEKDMENFINNLFKRFVLHC